MSYVFGKIELTVMHSVESSNEEMALLEANYKVNPQRAITWKLIGTDSDGNEFDVYVADMIKAELDEFLEG
ncbi:hypothetical protein LCM23_06130 [Cytobacillus kochii]|uniref:hypothetical protein n=1 Tax=Cytobacillus kochii TaxID=859143 RepID=UPI001CD3755F|nr:hypothetical protein [Cytobacillus kochii]MCA1025662.1 hypothetical protein [Cytobacillus kochii]